jgi:superfamily II DNA or RNA helicase
VGATYSIALADLEADELSELKRKLTLQSRSGFGATPPPFEAWFVDDVTGRIHMPRFYGLQQFGIAASDVRVEGEETCRMKFEGTLTHVQMEAAEAAFSKHLLPAGNGGVLMSLPCGYGKTVWAVAAACRLGRKTCVVVHKAVIKDQWLASFARFCPDAKVGSIQGSKWDVAGCDVVVAMILTLAKHSAPADHLDAFGLVIVDECHHLAAPVMNSAMRRFNAKYVIGLTATKDRPDGLTPLLYWSLGPLGFHVERDTHTEKVHVCVARYRGATHDILNKQGTPLMSVMLTRLASHAPRNVFLAAHIADFRRDGRVIIVLSDRKAQLYVLRDLLLQKHAVSEDEVGVFVQETRDRNAQLARPIVLCTYPMANEGVDKTEADTCVMATPKARVTQCIGRVQRPCATKQQPLVLDVVDDNALFMRLHWTRLAFYKKQRYTVSSDDRHA